MTGYGEKNFLLIGPFFFMSFGMGILKNKRRILLIFIRIDNKFRMMILKNFLILHNRHHKPTPTLVRMKVESTLLP
jgi:hypothetical protein